MLGRAKAIVCTKCWAEGRGLGCEPLPFLPLWGGGCKPCHPAICLKVLTAPEGKVFFCQPPVFHPQSPVPELFHRFPLGCTEPRTELGSLRTWTPTLFTAEEIGAERKEEETAISEGLLCARHVWALGTDVSITAALWGEPGHLHLGEKNN